MRKIHFADDLEERVAVMLDKFGIDFIHESEESSIRLDFFLPLYGIYIEVKKFHSKRISKQLSTQENVIVIQGRETINILENFLKSKL